MQPPDNIKRGQPLVAAVRNKLDEICAYLRATKLVKGKGIRVKETAAGTIVSMIPDRSSLDEEEEGEAAAVDYSGPFAVHVTTPPPEEEEEESETIGTEEEEEEDEGPGVYVWVSAGCVVVGETRYDVSAIGANIPIFFPNGTTLWLIGNINLIPLYRFSFVASDTPPVTSAGQFTTKIAENIGGVVHQLQFGEIVTVPWGISGAATYNGAFAVKLIGGTTAQIYNAAEPSSEYAGHITIGSTHKNMAVGTLSITPGTATSIYLTVWYDTTATPPALAYQFAKTLSSAVQGAQGWYKELAHIKTDGTLIQDHLSGHIEITGRWI